MVSPITSQTIIICMGKIYPASIGLPHSEHAGCMISHICTHTMTLCSQCDM